MVNTHIYLFYFCREKTSIIFAIRKEKSIVILFRDRNYGSVDSRLYDLIYKWELV